MLETVTEGLETYCTYIRDRCFGNPSAEVPTDMTCSLSCLVDASAFCFLPHTSPYYIFNNIYQINSECLLSQRPLQALAGG